MEMITDRNRLMEILREKSLKLGCFTLVSGQTSRYYLDSKFTTLDPEGAYLTARLILQELRRRDVKADAIGGLTLGADPIVSAVAAVSHVHPELYGLLRAFIIRKEPMKHGTQRFIEGFEPAAGTPVVIIDDVATTGGSTLRAIRGAEEAGMRVVAVLALVDREQGAQETLKDYPFSALFTARELLSAPELQQRLLELEAGQ